MKFVTYALDGKAGLAVVEDCVYRGYDATDGRYPGSLVELIAGGADLAGVGAQLCRAPVLDPIGIRIQMPLEPLGKIICVGLNYVDHASENQLTAPEYPVLFLRVPTSLVEDGAAMIRPQASMQLDYEGELVAVIGKGGRHIPRSRAHDHVIGYSVFNDGSLRDYQFRTGQWTMGKNFDCTGAFGPALVTADELPLGAAGLRLQTRLNGVVVQDANTSDMIFDVATLVATISVAITLLPGDMIVTGTPAGVGLARKPPLFMNPGDICEVEIERIGVLRSPIAEEELPQPTVP